MALQTLIANAVTSVNDLLAAQTPPVTIEEGETLVVETLDKRALYAVEFTASETAPVFSSDDNSWLRVKNEKGFIMPKGLLNAWIYSNQDAEVQLSVLPASGGGGAASVSDGASTEAKQTLQITEAQTTNDSVGSKADAVATTDTGSFSIVALLKRGLQNWASLLAKIPVLGQKLKAGSMPVVLASDQEEIKTKTILKEANTTISVAVEDGTVSSGALSLYFYLNSAEGGAPTVNGFNLGDTAGVSFELPFNAGYFYGAINYVVPEGSSITIEERRAV